jgi:hypothetical protein
MQRLAAMLAERCPEVKIIDPAGMPDGWDAADSGFTSWADARAWIAPRTSVFAQAAGAGAAETDGAGIGGARRTRA